MSCTFRIVFMRKRLFIGKMYKLFKNALLLMIICFFSILFLSMLGLLPRA